jgi:hypothetical protein
LNGKAFLGLNGLTQVWLNGNECIEGNFNEDDIADLSRTVSGKCGFCESDRLIDMNVCEAGKKIEKTEGLQLQVLTLEASIQQLFADKSDCLSDNEDKTHSLASKEADNAQLLSKIVRLEDELSFSKNQMKAHSEILEQMKDKIFEIRTKNLEIEQLKSKVEELQIKRDQVC